MDTIKLRILACDIDWYRENPGRNRNSDPLTRAMARATSNKWKVSRAGAYCRATEQRVEWPTQVQLWYDKFFAGEEVGGLTFEVKL